MNQYQARSASSGGQQNGTNRASNPTASPNGNPVAAPALPGAVDPEALHSFIAEVKAYLPKIQAGMVAYYQNPAALEQLAEAHGYIHTVQKAATVVGWLPLKNIASKLGELIERSAMGGLVLDQVVISAVDELMTQLLRYLDHWSAQNETLPPALLNALQTLDQAVDPTQERFPLAFAPPLAPLELLPVFVLSPEYQPETPAAPLPSNVATPSFITRVPAPPPPPAPAFPGQPLPVTQVTPNEPSDLMSRPEEAATAAPRINPAVTTPQPPPRPPAVVIPVSDAAALSPAQQRLLTMDTVHDYTPSPEMLAQQQAFLQKQASKVQSPLDSGEVAYALQGLSNQAIEQIASISGDMLSHDVSSGVAQTSTNNSSPNNISQAVHPTLALSSTDITAAATEETTSTGAITSDQNTGAGTASPRAFLSLPTMAPDPLNAAIAEELLEQSEDKTAISISEVSVTNTAELPAIEVAGAIQASEAESLAVEPPDTILQTPISADAPGIDRTTAELAVSAAIEPPSLLPALAIRPKDNPNDDDAILEVFTPDVGLPKAVQATDSHLENTAQRSEDDRVALPVTTLVTTPVALADTRPSETAQAPLPKRIDFDAPTLTAYPVRPNPQQALAEQPLSPEEGPFPPAATVSRSTPPAVSYRADDFVRDTAELPNLHDRLAILEQSQAAAEAQHAATLLAPTAVADTQQADEETPASLEDVLELVIPVGAEAVRRTGELVLPVELLTQQENAQEQSALPDAVFAAMFVSNQVGGEHLDGAKVCLEVAQETSSEESFAAFPAAAKDQPAGSLAFENLLNHELAAEQTFTTEALTTQWPSAAFADAASQAPALPTEALPLASVPSTAINSSAAANADEILMAVVMHVPEATLLADPADSLDAAILASHTELTDTASNIATEQQSQPNRSSLDVRPNVAATEPAATPETSVSLPVSFSAPSVMSRNPLIAEESLLEQPLTEMWLPMEMAPPAATTTSTESTATPANGETEDNTTTSASTSTWMTETWRSPANTDAQTASGQTVETLDWFSELNAQLLTSAALAHEAQHAPTTTRSIYVDPAAGLLAGRQSAGEATAANTAAANNETPTTNPAPAIYVENDGLPFPLSPVTTSEAQITEGAVPPVELLYTFSADAAPTLRERAEERQRLLQLAETAAAQSRANANAAAEPAESGLAQDSASSPNAPVSFDEWFAATNAPANNLSEPAAWLTDQYNPPTDAALLGGAMMAEPIIAAPFQATVEATPALTPTPSEAEPQVIVATHDSIFMSPADFASVSPQETELTETTEFSHGFDDDDDFAPTVGSTGERNSRYETPDTGNLHGSDAWSVPAELLEVFLPEAEEHLRVITLALPTLAKQPDNRTLLQEVRRSAHSLKGSSAVVGFYGITKLAHRMEDLLDLLYDGDLQLTPAMLQLLFASTEALENLLNQRTQPEAVHLLFAEYDQLLTASHEGDETIPAVADITADAIEREATSVSDQQAMPLQRQLLETMPTAPLALPANTAVGVSDAHANQLASDLGQPPAINVATPEKETKEAVARAIPSATSLTTASDTTMPGRGNYVRVPIERLDSVVKLITELMVTRAAFEQTMKQMKHQLDELRDNATRLSRVASKMEGQFEASALNSGLSLGVPTTGRLGLTAALPAHPFALNGGNGMARAGLSPLLAPVGKSDGYGFDALEFDRYTEFHLLLRELTECAGDIKALERELVTVREYFNSSLNRQGRLTTEMQDQVMRLRMVPLGTLASRLHRTAHQVATQLGKSVNFVLEGEDTRLDKTVIEEMTDPLLHLLRNAIDHGLETPAERQQHDKSPTGLVRLRAYHEGTQTIIQIADDGAGINYERLRQIAIRSGLISPAEVARLADEELQMLIFLPGFSTANSVSEISGRGVGMDIVKTTIQRLKGRIALDSKPGQGTIITIRLPMTLAVMRALLVKTGKQTYAVPPIGLQQIVKLTPNLLSRIGEQTVVRAGDRLYPLMQLNRLLGLRNVSEKSERVQLALLLTLDEHNIAVAVDEVLGGRDIVVKTLGNHLRHVRGITGATLMGDGSAVLILNLPELVREAIRPQSVVATRLQANAMALARAAVSPTERNHQQITVMVVDDSLSVRRVLANRLISVGWNAVQAKDGLDALEQLQQLTALPAVILLDIEMPRMDGYEFLTALRKSEAHQHIPVVMITSRAGQKHRDRAFEAGATDYLVKPYQDEHLLGLIRRLAKLEETSASTQLPTTA